MSFYSGRHAELYDLFYETKPYQQESNFVHDCFSMFQARPIKEVLEIACGTGNHAFALEKQGYKIKAVDISEDMIRRAQEKAKSSGSSVEFQKQDMRHLEFHDGSFDAILCLFDSIGYVVTDHGVDQVLKEAHRVLKPEGVFLFEFWHSAAIVKLYDPLRLRRWETEKTNILRIAETTLDVAQQTAQVHYTIYELGKDSTYTHVEETQTNRYFSIPEMHQRLTARNFLPLRWFSGFDSREPVTDQTWHIVAVAKRI